MDVEEIRVNQDYSIHSISKYEGDNEINTPIINRRTIRTNKLLEKIQDNLKNQLEYKVDNLFPPNCRYFEQYQEGFLVVIEEPPAFRTIAVEKDMSNELASLRASGKLKEYGYENWQDENPNRPYMFNLAMPYVVFCLSFTKQYDILTGHVFFRPRPISGFSDPIFKAPFLNISEGNQAICFGDKIHKGPKKSIFTDTNHAISTFWSTVFNVDYMYNYVAYQNTPGVSDYFTWEYYSHTDPMFIYNIDWIRFKNHTIGGVVEKMRDKILSRESQHERELSYNKLTSLFNAPQEGELTEVPGLDGVQEPLIYDVSQNLCVEMYHDLELNIEVGDSFKVKDKYLFIDSFLGFRKRVYASYVNIQREDGRIFKWKLTNKVKEFIAEKIKEERFINSIELPTGETLKAGDILILKNNHDQKVYRKVYYIRQSSNGDLEGRVGSEFYIMNNLPEDCRVMDLSNPEYMGIKLEKDKHYFVIRNSIHSSAPIVGTSKCKFLEITTGRYSNLIAKFQDVYRSDSKPTIEFSQNSTTPKLFKAEDCKPLPPVFRIGRKLLYLRDQSQPGSMGETQVIPNIGVARQRGCDLRSPSFSIYKELIKDDTFTICGPDLDIQFTIGDKVVVCDWQNPINMLIVRQIEGFVTDNETGDIRFVLKDKNDEIIQYRYVKGGRTPVVNVGKIRKITNIFEDITAGTKIIANKPGVSMFPKKDINIIVGFLYDTGGPEPLVLCSNCCTLWFSDVINKFDHIPISDSKWESLKHAPINPSKMRFQAGDIIQGNRYYKERMGYLAYRPVTSRTIRAQRLDYYTNYEESYSFDREFNREAMFDSFPNPRLTSTQEEKLGFVNAFPNFHGMYTVTSKYFSQFLFANDPRSILNVSDSDK